MSKNEITTTGGCATYCPEDDKLRLYVGRVPRDEYERLRSEGWTSTPKQDCQFAAVWTPGREDTALEYSPDGIEDEDKSPADRAADRAERFAGYRDKREGEALDKADQYDSGPLIHGHQSAELAESRAARHDMQATRAVNLWGKAEYWQRRTAGVIDHALHVSAPGVRMGRIKTLEAELRRCEAQYTPESGKRYIEDGEEICICGMGRDRHTVKVSKLDDIKAAYFRAVEHLRLRLAYENQMLDAQGGRLAHVEMVAGGWLGNSRIMKVNKSTVTGRVVSVAVKVPRVSGWAYKVANVPGTDYALMTVETERLKPELYRAPTPEELAEFETEKKAEKKAKAEVLTKAPPLINPTNEDAERLQAVWNAQRKQDKPVIYSNQTSYSLNLKHGSATSKDITGGGFQHNANGWSRFDFPVVAKVRGSSGQVIVLTDKPQKPFPENVWHDPRPETRAEVLGRLPELVEACQLRVAAGEFRNKDKMTETQSVLFNKAVLVGLAFVQSWSQWGMSEEGYKLASEAGLLNDAHVS